MPDGVTFEEAASLPVAYGTAHRMLITHQTVKSGDKVLILGCERRRRHRLRSPREDAGRGSDRLCRQRGESSRG
jgi:hypothetical protein